MKKRSLTLAILSAAIVSAGVWTSTAQALQTTQAVPPASAPGVADGEHMTIRVAEVKGKVAYQEQDGGEWKPATVGLVLNEGASFRTGLRAQVTFTLPPNQTITLDRLGTIKVLQALKQKGAYTTDVGMKYGQVHYEVQAAGIEHESTVRTPNSTLAVRGTGVIVSDQRPFPPEVIHFDGLAEWQSGNRRQILASGKSTAVGDQAAAQTALLTSVVDPNIAFARTQNELPLVTNLLSQGAVFQVGNSKQIPIVRGGTPPTDAQLPGILPGALDFVLRWDGNANLDLLINNQATGGESLYPATGINSSPSGGLIPFDHRGGKHGGIELAYWQGKFDPGLYDIVVTDVSGKKPVNFKVDVYEHGTHNQIDDVILNNGRGALVQTLTGTLNKGENYVGIAPVGGVLPPIQPVFPFDQKKLSNSTSVYTPAASSVRAGRK